MRERLASLQNCLLPWGLWLVLFAPLLRWLLTVPFSHANYRLNLILLVAVAALVAGRALREGGLGLRSAPRLSLPAALLALCAAAGYVAVDHGLRLHTLAAILFGLGTYGLLGLYLPRAVWRGALGSALLFVAVLPFGAHGNSYLGLGVRVLVAHLTQVALSGLSIGAVSAQTILVLENGIAHIDVPCSGLRSLWAGGLFYLLATWALRRHTGLRWVLGGVLLGAMLIAANTGRVLVLVVLGLHLKLWRIGEVLHLPLGVIGFVVSCAAALLYLLHLPPRPTPRPTNEAAAEPSEPAAPRWFVPLLSISLLALIAAHTQRPKEPDPTRHPQLTFPAELSPQPVPLDPGEVSLFSRFGARANKWRIAVSGAASGSSGPALTGSVLTVSASSVRAQHPPELCLVAHGLKILSVQTVELVPGAPMRLLVSQGLGQGQASGRRHTAVNWFQSRTQTVDSFLGRIGVTLLGRERSWVLVSVLLDREAAPDDPRLRALLGGLHAAIQSDLGAPRAGSSFSEAPP
jgi:exosortase O